MVMAMAEPGDEGGDCPRCATRMVQIGHGHTVLAAHCPGCELILSLGGDVATIHDYPTSDPGDFDV